MLTVLITGCSSGFGLETAKLFLQNGWNVIATMRVPQPAVLPTSDRLRILALEVTNPASIAQAICDAGSIDVLVNNAGFGALFPVELASIETARALFETNTLGPLAMMQAVLPQFRLRRSGVVINVTSAVTLKSLPLVGIYRASKAAVNAYTESLSIEVAAFGVRAHLVLPGRSPETKFGETARKFMQEQDDADYKPMIERVLAGMRDAPGPVTHAKDVAQAIWRAATDPSAPFRLAAGADAEIWMEEAN